MKTAIHPDWHPEAQITCACGNSFTVGSTVPKIHVEVCASCHPFFTGEQKFVDTRGRVDRFRELEQRKTESRVSKKEKRQNKRLLRLQEEMERPESLEEIRKQVKQ